MYKEEFNTAVSMAKKKLALLENNPLGYFCSSFLAGMYVGLGMILIATIGGLLDGSPATKIVMGLSFGIALSLVLMAGSDLFTGNTLIMPIASLKKEVPWSKTFKVWTVCFIGNWVGSIAVALLYHFSGLQTGAVGEFTAHFAYKKMSAPIPELFIKGILCNILVCLAVWCYIKLKSESGKLIMIFWCLFGFITSSYEHCVANMSILTLGLLSPFEEAISLNLYFTNIIFVTLGNIVGALVFVVLPYYLIQRDTEK